MRLFCTFSLSLLLLPGCVSLGTLSTYVTNKDAQLLASEAANQLATDLPPARTTIAIYPTSTTFAKEITTQLRAKGFAVAVPESNHFLRKHKKHSLTAIPVHFLLSPFFSGVLLRMQYQGREVTRFYNRTDTGVLVSTSPATVRPILNSKQREDYERR